MFSQGWGTGSRMAHVEARWRSSNPLTSVLCSITSVQGLTEGGGSPESLLVRGMSGTQTWLLLLHPCHQAYLGVFSPGFDIFQTTCVGSGLPQAPNLLTLQIFYLHSLHPTKNFPATLLPPAKLDSPSQGSPSTHFLSSEYLTGVKIAH